jgi:hypothetical protein
MPGSQVLQRLVLGFDGVEAFETVLVVVNGGFGGDHESGGEGVGRDLFVIFMGAEGNLHGLHEGDVNEVFGFDLGHEVFNH